MGGDGGLISNIKIGMGWDGVAWAWAWAFTVFSWVRAMVGRRIGWHYGFLVSLTTALIPAAFSECRFTSMDGVGMFLTPLNSILLVLAFIWRVDEVVFVLEFAR